MSKIIGAVLIIVACFLAGRLPVILIKRRQKQLNEIIRSLLALETEISYAGTPLPLALKKSGAVGGGLGGGFFVQVGTELLHNCGISAEVVWQEILEKMENRLALTEDDLLIMRDLGFGLGLSHKDDQLKKIELIRNRLNSQVADVAECEKKMTKIWCSLSWFAGIAVVLIFF